VAAVEASLVAWASVVPGDVAGRLGPVLLPWGRGGRLGRM